MWSRWLVDVRRHVEAVAVLLLLLSPPAPAGDGCHGETYAGSGFTVCSFDAATEALRIYWGDAGGTPYRTFDALAQALAERGVELDFAINGGIYRQDFTPLGLLVIGGEVVKGVNTVDIAPGSGLVPNFYKKPNGIFYLTGRTAGVMETAAYLAAAPEADFATQSGPMLVIDGELHPAFIPDSPSRLRRSGVGVSGGSRVHFAISDAGVDFDTFARLFRDRLGCTDALFLDGGSAPGIHAPDLGRDDPPGHGGYGPIIAVVRESGTERDGGSGR